MKEKQHNSSHHCFSKSLKQRINLKRLSLRFKHQRTTHSKAKKYHLLVRDFYFEIAQMFLRLFLNIFNLFLVQKINDFLKKTEMKYATTIIGSKNRADLILRQESDILTVISQLELIEKYKKTLSFDPVVGVAERKQ